MSFLVAIPTLLILDENRAGVIALTFAGLILGAMYQRKLLLRRWFWALAVLIFAAEVAFIVKLSIFGRADWLIAGAPLMIFNALAPNVAMWVVKRQAR